MQQTDKTGEKICLFGGTFDPIHIAHLRIANEALKRFELQKILFVPAAHPPHKRVERLTPFEDRFRMVEIACAPYECFVPSRLEAGQETSYTIDTLERFRAEIPPDTRLYFLIGADAFDEVKTWHRWEDVLTMVEFIVVSRPGKIYDVPAGATVHALPDLDLSISSSVIREQLAAGKTVGEVPAEVRDYIEQRHLYRNEDVTPTA
jgi:nicotinate-nucleotide adenylyltransferase